jgi:hypothetical protein
MGAQMSDAAPKGFLRDNSLTLAFLLLLVLALVGQAFSGVAEFNHQQVVDGAQQLSLWQYVTSSSFAVDVAENWQSEYLQFALYAEPNSPAWARAGGWRAALYGRSLGAIMTFFFLMSLAAQSVAGEAAYNVDLLHQHEDPVSWLGYATSADFWNRTTQNWQSEFLAVASMAAFAIYLRQRGSPESKPVGAPHSATGEES